MSLFVCLFICLPVTGLLSVSSFALKSFFHNDFIKVRNKEIELVIIQKNREGINIF